MGLFGDSEDTEKKPEFLKEEKKSKPEKYEIKKNKKGKVSLIVAGKKIIVDVDGNGEEVKYNERDHAHLKVGDIITF